MKTVDEIMHRLTDETPVEANSWYSMKEYVRLALEQQEQEWKAQVDEVGQLWQAEVARVSEALRIELARVAELRAEIADLSREETVDACMEKGPVRCRFCGVMNGWHKKTCEATPNGGGMGGPCDECGKPARDCQCVYIPPWPESKPPESMPVACPSTFLVDQTGMWEPTKDWCARNGSEVEFYAKRIGRCGGGRT